MEQRELDIEEKQADTVKEIARHKVKQAYEKLGEPVIVQDGGFFVEGLEGFPGPYVRFVLDTVGVKSLLRLAKKNSGCFFRNVVAFKDRDNLKLFVKDKDGTLTNEPREIKNEKAWSDLWKVFVPEGWNKTLGEMSEKEYERYEKENVKNSALKEFGKWFSNNR